MIGINLEIQELLDQLDITGSLDVTNDFDADYAVAGEQVSEESLTSPGLKVITTNLFSHIYFSKRAELISLSPGRSALATKFFSNELLSLCFPVFIFKQSNLPFKIFLKNCLTSKLSNKKHILKSLPTFQGIFELNLLKILTNSDKILLKYFQ